MRTKELAHLHLRSALAGDQLSTADEIKQDLNPTKSSGFYGRYEGAPLVSDFIARAEEEDGDVLKHSMRKFRERNYPCVYSGKMKSELVSKLKLLKRKQRMFMMQDKTHVTLHKHFYGKQSKRLRKYKEIAHGVTWFYGAVHRLAEELGKSNIVQSEDDEFWDKNFVWMNTIYEIRNRVQDSMITLTEEQMQLRNAVVRGLREVILVLPTGDVILITDRVNPSGADATTENNCIARILVEIYMQVLYSKVIDKPLSGFPEHKPGTKYLGDDRIAGDRDYPEGYLEFYKHNLHLMGVKLKTIEHTKGPQNAEFAGFKLMPSHWDNNYFVPYYSTEKLWVGMFASPDVQPNIIMSKFMAFSLLLYPRYGEYLALKPLVIEYLQTLPESILRDVTISFWADEAYLRRAWTGHESGATEGGGILERCPTPESKCALQDALSKFSIAC